MIRLINLKSKVRQKQKVCIFITIVNKENPLIACNGKYSINPNNQIFKISNKIASPFDDYNLESQNDVKVSILNYNIKRLFILKIQQD